MTVDAKRVVLAFLDDIVRTGGMGLAAQNHAADDVTWWLPGSVRDDALRGKKEVVSWYEQRGAAGKLFRAPPEVVVERVVIDHNMAAAQIRTRGSALTGKTYDNRYALVMTVEGGRITELRTFYDTKHVLDTLKSEPTTEA